VKIFIRDVRLDKEDTVKFWKSSGLGFGSRNFYSAEAFAGSAALAQVCPLRVLLLLTYFLLLQKTLKCKLKTRQREIDNIEK